MPVSTTFIADSSGSVWQLGLLSDGTITTTKVTASPPPSASMSILVQDVALSTIWSVTIGTDGTLTRTTSSGSGVAYLPVVSPSGYQWAIFLSNGAFESVNISGSAPSGSPPPGGSGGAPSSLSSAGIGESISGDFNEEQFPANLTDGRGGSSFRGGPQFNTTITLASSGDEQRNMNWVRSLNKYNVGYILADDTAKAELLDFFNACAGMKRGFRFKDWLDYTVSQGSPAGSTITAYDLGPAEAYGLPTSGGSGYAVGDTGFLNSVYWDGASFNDATYLVTSVDGSGAVTGFILTNPGTQYFYVETMPTLTGGPQPGSGTGFVMNIISIADVAATPPTGVLFSESGLNPYRLAKMYTDAAGYRHFRLISKPCSGLVTDATGHTPPVPQLYIGGQPATPELDYDIDFTTGEIWISWTVGIIGFDPGWNYVSNGANNETNWITWSGEFDVPVRFMSDVQKLLLQDYSATDWPAIELTELKLSPRAPSTPIVPAPPGFATGIARFDPEFYAMQVGDTTGGQVRLVLNGVGPVTAVLVSSNTSVVTVPATMTIASYYDYVTLTPVAAGTATVTAVYNGKVATLTVKVYGS